MKVNIKSLPKGYSIINGQMYKEGGTTGDQSNYGLIGVPSLDSTNDATPFSSVNYSLNPVPRDEANLEAEAGETVLTDMNNDGDFELYNITGNRHHKGGTPLNLPPQSFIYSDTSKMRLNKFELAEMGVESKKKISPAKMSKNYQLNNFIALLDNEHSDHITKDTAEYMLTKNKKSLSQLAFLQEAKKKFEDGVPLAAYPYLDEKGINPLEFSQQIEQISAQEAEQKMMAQLPFEEQLEILQMKKQMAMQQQQQQAAMAQQGPQMGGPQGMPPQGMPQGMPPQGPPQMGPPQGGGMPPQGPPQGMMPPQPPMQQPAMARRGGQLSRLLPKIKKSKLAKKGFVFEKGGTTGGVSNEKIKEQTYTLRIVQYPYGYRGGSNGSVGAMKMDPGHMESFIINQDNLPGKWNKKDKEGKYVYKGYVNRWGKEDQEYDPGPAGNVDLDMDNLSGGDYENGVRTVDMELTKDELDYYMSTAQKFKPMNPEDLLKLSKSMTGVSNSQIPINWKQIIPGYDLEPYVYDLSESNCAGGVCDALDINTSMTQGLKRSGTVDPTRVMDHLMTLPNASNARGNRVEAKDVDMDQLEMLNNPTAENLIGTAKGILGLADLTVGNLYRFGKFGVNSAIDAGNWTYDNVLEPTGGFLDDVGNFITGNNQGTIEPYNPQGPVDEFGFEISNPNANYQNFNFNDKKCISGKCDQIDYKALNNHQFNSDFGKAWDNSKSKVSLLHDELKQDISKIDKILYNLDATNGYEEGAITKTNSDGSTSSRVDPATGRFPGFEKYSDEDYDAIIKAMFEKEGGEHMRRGGELPQAQFGYFGTRDEKSNRNQSLKTAGITTLASILGRTIPQVVTRYNRKNDAWENFENYQDSKFGDGAFGSMSNWESWTDYCENNTCPSFENFTPNSQDFHSGQYGNTQNWYNNADMLQDWQYEDNLWKGIKKGVGDGLRTGAINYSLNALLDNTRWGNKLQKNFDINLGWLGRQKYGSELPKAQYNVSDSIYNMDIPGFTSMSGDHGYGPGGYNMPQNYVEHNNYLEAPTIETGNTGENNSPVILNTDQIIANLEKQYNTNLNAFVNASNQNIQSYENQMNSMIPPIDQQMNMLGVTGAVDPRKVEMWEAHINKGGQAPTTPDANYTQAYKNIYDEEPEYEESPDNQSSRNVTNIYNTFEGNPEGNNEDQGSPGPGYIRMPGDGSSNGAGQPTTPGRAQGLPLDYTNTNSPYYVGSNWAFATGGGLPSYQDDGEVDFNQQVKNDQQLLEDRDGWWKRNIFNPIGDYWNNNSLANMWADKTALTNSMGVGGLSLPMVATNYLISQNYRDNVNSMIDEFINIQGPNNIFGTQPIEEDVNWHPKRMGGSFATGGDLPKAQYSVSDNLYNTPVAVADNTSVYIDPAVNADMSGYTKHNNPDALYKWTMGLFGNKGGYYKDLDPSLYSDENLVTINRNAIQPVGGTMPFIGTGPQVVNAGLESIYDYFSPEGGTFGDFMGWSPKAYGGDLPKANDGIDFGAHHPHTASNPDPDILNIDNLITNDFVHAAESTGTQFMDQNLYTDLNQSAKIVGQAYPELVTEWNPQGIFYGETTITPSEHTITDGGYAARRQAMIAGNPISSMVSGFANLLGYEEGGELPMAKDGIEYNGEIYSEKDLRKLKESKDPVQIDLYNAITGDVYKKEKKSIEEVMKEINQTRINTEETSQEFIGGTEDWSTRYMSDGESDYRDSRYKAYKDYREGQGKSVISPEEYHKAYAMYQRQNNWMKENLSDDERNNPSWDRLHTYEPCTKGEADCNEIDGKWWRKTGTEQDANFMYNNTFKDNADMPALDADLIEHIQAGYIGGQALVLNEESYDEFMQTGVSDQTTQFLDINGNPITLNISPDDKWFGNTTNQQYEKAFENTPAEQCTNAEGMEIACVEAGGTWTPYNATDKTGCECSKPLDPEKIPPPKKKRPPEFWLQDELGLANAMDTKMSLQKRYPWAPHYDQIGIDAVFDDPTREIAAIGEQASIAASAATAFGGPQRGIAAASLAQGKAMTAIADTVNKVHGNNITVANDVNVKNAEMQYKTQMLNNNELKQLYDNTVLTEENYDNALRKANANITTQLQNTYTNMANTANLNSIYPQFDISAANAGLINITDPKAFYADPNYVDQKSHMDNYTETIRELKNLGIPPDQWPKYAMPPNQNTGNTWAQQNATGITNSGYPGNKPGVRYGRETRRENRILKKGGQLRNWFSPLRGN